MTDEDAAKPDEQARPGYGIGRGWIKLERKFFGSWMWEEPRSFSRAEAWLDLFRSASFATQRRLINGRLISLNPGELVTAERFLEKRWRWSRTKVRTFLSHLMEDRLLDRRKEQGQTVLIVLNYRDCDGLGREESTTEKTGNKPKKTRGGTNRKPKYKNIKNNHNEKNGERESAYSLNGPSSSSGRKPEALQVLIAYATEIGVSKSDAEAFFDSQEAGGWTRGGKPLHCWKASLRTWKRNGYLASQKNGVNGSAARTAAEGYDAGGAL